MLEEFVQSKPDIPCNAAEEDGGDIPARMERNGGRPSVRMAELLVGAFLAHLCEPELLQNGGNLPRL
jgi:hypothetical protein